MKFRILLAVAGLAAAGTAVAHGPSNVLFRFDGGVGVQPFRSAAGVPALNVVAGVNPGGAPWLIKSFEIFEFRGFYENWGISVCNLAKEKGGSEESPRAIFYKHMSGYHRSR